MPRVSAPENRTPSPPIHRREGPSLELEQDFWTGRRSSHRPSSVRSYSSSRNSSLHGSSAMDPSYQEAPPFISSDNERHGSVDTDKSPRGLFPAPVDWVSTQSPSRESKEFSFDCEICGETIKVNRRLEWQ